MGKKREKPFKVALLIDRELIALAPDPKAFLRKELERFHQGNLQEIENCPIDELLDSGSLLAARVNV